ncbi:MAG TPA: LapA family protein [Solirubrobacteraceae bacterium]|nr:LapA family protein [Solirubrobacteraceae bacterium]
MSLPASEDSPERSAQQAPPAEPPTSAEPGTPPSAGEVPSTRTGTAFKTLIAGAVVLILLLVFILENTESVKIAYFGAGFHLPLGVALLLAAIGGALLAGILGTARILQLRRHLRRRL